MRKRQWLAGIAVVFIAFVGTAGVAAAQESTTPTTVKFANSAAKECHEKLEQGATIDDCQQAPSPILPFSFVLLFALTGFEVLVSFLQAFIFTILTAVYIGGTMHPEH